MHVVVTGANRGIGLALAERYRSQGAHVTGTSRSGGDLFKLDVTRPSDQARLADYLAGQPVDLLVCNAGVFLDKGQSLETGYGADIWSETLAANVTGVFLTVQALLPHLRQAEAGKIAIIASQMGSSTLASGSSIAYRVSKAAAINLGLNLSAALKPEGIATGIYHPGWVQTDMGGAAADISVDASADGLVARFEALGIESTGCFETWDGRAHAL